MKKAEVRSQKSEGGRQKVVKTHLLLTAFFNSAQPRSSGFGCLLLSAFCLLSLDFPPRLA
jgi:hypothetical protein